MLCRGLHYVRLWCYVVLLYCLGWVGLWCGVEWGGVGWSGVGCWVGLGWVVQDIKSLDCEPSVCQCVWVDEGTRDGGTHPRPVSAHHSAVLWSAGHWDWV